MFKSIYGSITQTKTGETKDIIVTPLSSKNIRDFLIGSGIVSIGMSYLAISAFRNGANAYEKEEYNVLKSLGLIHDRIE